MLEAIEEGPQFFCLSAPPRHGKSVLLCHFVARYMLRHPGARVAYCCYAADLAEEFSTNIKGILASIGVEIDKSANTKGFWRIGNGSTLLAVGPAGGFTGRGADLVVVDDPYKSRADAESGLMRERIWNWFTSVAMTRLEPGGSLIVTHTRWNVDDLIGRLVSQQNRQHYNFPAINEQGEALWPERFPVDVLLEKKAGIGEYDWASLYQGEPRPRGGAVFGDTTTYEDKDLPKTWKKITIGIDLAYTKKTHSDYSVAVVLGTDDNGIHYVLDVRRMQVEQPAFEQVLRQLRSTYNYPAIYWYTGGTEKGVADLFVNKGVPVKAIQAKEDKFMRSQAVAAAWNAGKVRVPSENRPWLNAFLSEVLLFTGLDDPNDDQVDALAAAFIPASKKHVTRGPVLP